MNIIEIVTNTNNTYKGDLIHYFNNVMNSPNVHMPYHNLRHSLHVLWEAYDGGVHMGLNGEEFRCLLIAALYHDFDHTGSRSDGGDIVNINRAIAAIERDILDDDLFNLSNIIRYIKATEYPYKEIELDLPSKIVRDADMSQTFSNVWIQSILFDLGSELNMSYSDMLRFQIPFLKNIKFFTSWGESKFRGLVATRLKEVDSFINVINLGK